MDAKPDRSAGSFVRAALPYTPSTAPPRGFETPVAGSVVMHLPYPPVLPVPPDAAMVQSSRAGGGRMQLLWRWREKAQALGDRRRLGTAFDSHLGQNIGDVDSCRLRADEEGGGDLPVRESAPDQPKNLTFTPRQAQFLGAHQAWQRCFRT